MFRSSRVLYLMSGRVLACMGVLVALVGVSGPSEGVFLAVFEGSEWTSSTDWDKCCL